MRTHELKITLTKPADSWGDQGFRTHQYDSEVVCEDRLGMLTISVRQGAVSVTGKDADPERARCEAVAAISLPRSAAATLAAFLAALPADDA